MIPAWTKKKHGISIDQTIALLIYVKVVKAESKQKLRTPRISCSCFFWRLFTNPKWAPRGCIGHKR